MILVLGGFNSGVAQHQEPNRTLLLQNLKNGTINDDIVLRLRYRLLKHMAIVISIGKFLLKGRTTSNHIHHHCGRIPTKTFGIFIKKRTI